MSSTNSTKNRGELVFWKGKPFLLHMCHSSFYSCYKPSDMLRMKHMRVNNFTRAVMRIIYIYIYLYWCNLRITSIQLRGHRDHMVVGFITTYAIGAYRHLRCEFEPHSGEVDSIQHCVIKIGSDLRQVGENHRILWLPPPLKLTTMI